MAADIDALNARALAHRDRVLAQLWYRDGRVSNEVRSLNWGAPKLIDLHVRLDEAGHWSVIADSGCAQGRGAVALVATLADVSVERAAQFLVHVLVAAEAAP
jgi:hypothetical protein